MKEKAYNPVQFWDSQKLVVWQLVRNPMYTISVNSVSLVVNVKVSIYYDHDYL